MSELNFIDSHTRITIDIPDELHSELKRVAAQEGSTIRELVIRALEREIRGDEVRTSKINLPIIPSKTPGTLKLNNKKIFDLIGFP